MLIVVSSSRRSRLSNRSFVVWQLYRDLRRLARMDKSSHVLLACAESFGKALRDPAGRDQTRREQVAIQ